MGGAMKNLLSLFSKHYLMGTLIFFIALLGTAHSESLSNIKYFNANAGMTKGNIHQLVPYGFKILGLTRNKYDPIARCALFKSGNVILVGHDSKSFSNIQFIALGKSYRPGSGASSKLDTWINVPLKDLPLKSGYSYVDERKNIPDGEKHPMNPRKTTYSYKSGVLTVETEKTKNWTAWTRFLPKAKWVKTNAIIKIKTTPDLLTPKSIDFTFKRGKTNSKGVCTNFEIDKR